MLIPAKFYVKQGVSVIPCKDKRPVIKSWKEFQSRIMTDDEVDSHFNDNTEQVAIIAGVVSGGLEIIDFDLKNLDPLDRELWWTNFNADLIELNSDLFKKLQFHSTPTGGYHVLYRCEEIEGNQKLAKVKIKDKYECIIETRGKGGYVIAPPSTRTEGGVYKCVNDTFALHFLDVDERELLINFCKSFNQEPEVIVHSKKSTKTNSAFKRSPFDDYNQEDDVLNVLQKHGWKAVQDAGTKIFFRRPGSENFQSANWHKQKKIFYVFSSGDAFLEGGKGYNASQVYTILEHKGDFKESYKALIREGFGSHWSDDERRSIDRVKELVSSNAHSDKIKAEILKDHPSWLNDDIDKIISVASSLVNEGEFWFVNNKGTLLINNLAFVNFLHNILGYALWKESTESELPLIKMDKINHQVEIIHADNFVKDDVKNWILANVSDEDNAEPKTILNAVLGKDNKLFGKKMYEWLPMVSFNTFNDTFQYSYFFFRNGIVRVSKESVELTKYEELDANTYIWKDRIKCDDFNIEIFNEDDDIGLLEPKYTYDFLDKESGKEANGTGSSWYKFIRRISAVSKEYDQRYIHQLPDEQKIRLLSTMSMMGYLLSSYKDETFAKAIIINEDTSEDGKGGGSGKQIFTNGLGKLRNTKEEDGKTFDPKSQFAFQGINESHDVFILDDVQKRFNIETLYHMITNDMVVEERNKGRKTIPFSVSPKFVISSNFDIIGTADQEHATRRFDTLLFNCYFNSTHKPIHEVGWMLGKKWNDGQWQCFYNTMFICSMVYLSNSIIPMPDTASTKEKALRNRFGDELFEFLYNTFSEEEDWMYEWFVLKKMFARFKDMTDSKMSVVNFKNALLSYLKKYFPNKHVIEKKYNGNSSYFDSGNGGGMFPDEIEDTHYYRHVLAIKIVKDNS